MFLSQPPRVKAPEGPRTTVTPAPRVHKKKQPEYIYTDEPGLNYKDIVLSVTNGLEASQIDPELYPSVYPMLQTQFIRMKGVNPCAAQKLQEALEYMLDYKPEEPGRVIAVGSTRVVEQEEEYNPPPELIEEGVQIALEGGDLWQLESPLLPFLVPPLRKIRMEALDEGKYLKAQQAEQGARNVLRQQTLKQQYEANEEKNSTIQEKLEIAQIQLENIKEKWACIIAQQKNQHKEELDAIQEDFERELEEFDKLFERDPPAKAVKFSPQLLDMRAKERFLGRSKRYQEAKALKEQADALEAIELQQRKQQWIKYLDGERLKLIEKHRQKAFVHDVNAQSIINKRKREADAEISHAQKTVNHLKRQLEKNDMMSESVQSSRTDTRQKLPPLYMNSNRTSHMNTVR